MVRGVRVQCRCTEASVSAAYETKPSSPVSSPLPSQLCVRITRIKGIDCKTVDCPACCRVFPQVLKLQVHRCVGPGTGHKGPQAWEGMRLGVQAC